MEFEDAVVESVRRDRTLEGQGGDEGVGCKEVAAGGEVDGRS